MFVIEPLFALLSCALIYWGIAVWRRLSSEFESDPDFERWCAGAPLVMAFRCASADDARELRMLLRQAFAPTDLMVNHGGGAPWQYYHYEVDVRLPTETVVAVHLCGARVQRGSGKECVDAAAVVARMLEAPPTIAEVWLHGQLRPSDAPSRQRDRVHWIGRDDFAPMIGQPVWATPLP